MLVVGLDWGRLSHEFVAVEINGRTSLYSGTVENSTSAFEEWANTIESILPGQPVRLAVESGNGLSYPVEVFAGSRGWEVVTLSATSVKAYREHVMRKNNKTDRIDALAIARLAAEMTSSENRGPNHGRAFVGLLVTEIKSSRTRLVSLIDCVNTWLNFGQS